MLKVSVIIPMYNSESFIEQCLDSVCNQTLKEIEIICVDDGSTDRTLELAKKIQEKDDRIQIIEQENQGAGAARNNGLLHATGEYLSFLDSDDYFETTMLEDSYNKAHDTQADICVFDADLYDESTQQYRPCTWAFRRQYFPENAPFSPKQDDVKENIFRMFNGWPWDKLFRREFILEQHLEYQNLRTTNDMFFVFIALAKAEKIITLDKILIHQRVEVKSSLSRTREKSWDCFYIALEAMQDELKQSGLYEIFEKAFVNWSINFSLWQINSLKDHEIYQKVYELLRTKGFEKFGIARHDRSYFFSKKEYEQFLRIYTVPFKD